VESVTPIYARLAPWKNPETGRSREIFVVGIDSAANALDIPEIAALRARLRLPGLVLFDEASRPEFGPVAARFRAGDRIETEVSGRHVTVDGLFRLGTSFGIDGTVVTSDVNFLQLFPAWPPGLINIGLIRLRPGADPVAIRDALAAVLPKDVTVLTKQDYIAREKAYWATSTPIGYVFAFGVVMGWCVGAVIVYQILFADVAAHLRGYATLRAIGYPNTYLVAVVFIEGLILALVGYLPGLALCAELYRLAAWATRLPMAIAPGRSVQVFVLTVAMCGLSGALALRKVRAADPADIF
jgi:putative ABC transport system permease protein